MIDPEEEETDRLEEDVHKARRRDSRQKWGLFVLAMLLMAACAVIWILLQASQDRGDRAEGKAVAEQSEKKEIAKEAQQVLCGTKDREIYDRELCAKWAEAAQEPVAPASETPAGPSREELVAAFREYCAAGNCKGQDGANPTPDDIAAAFVKFCSTRDGCRGPSGTAGADGKDGADGKPGADGQAVGPTQEMVLSVITTYCSTRNDCRGPAGADGPPGKDGPPPPEDAIIAAVQKVCTSSDVCRGPAGADGQPGKDGIDGKDGADGRSPESFTWTDRFGTTYTCTPNPPGSATYTCDPTGPPPPVIGVNP